MRNSSPPEDKAWVLAGPARALDRLAPLIRAHRAHRPVCLVANAAEARSQLADAASILVVGDGGTPGRALPGLFLTAPDGRRVPAGWLPDARLGRYAAAAAAIHARPQQAPAPIAILSERDTRALALAQSVLDTLPPPARGFLWTAERLSRASLTTALGIGLAAALYVGHARAGGWLGYSGFGRDSLARAAGRQPIGALLSLGCSTASRPRHGYSFAEYAVLTGLCGAALAATRPTLHALNDRLARALARACQADAPQSLAGLLLAVADESDLLGGYRILGDPLMPLVGIQDGDAMAQAVFAPAPDAILPVVPLAAWAAC